MAAAMKTFRLGDVVERSLDQARLSGRKPARLLVGPEIWPVFTIPGNVPSITLNQHPPTYRGLRCYKMHAPGIAVVTV